MADSNARIYGRRWRVIREIGRGGQGIVYEVEDTSDLNTEDVLLERLKIVLSKVKVPISYEDTEVTHRELIQLIRKISATTSPRAALKELLPPDESVNERTALDRMKSTVLDHAENGTAEFLHLFCFPSPQFIAESPVSS